MDTIESVYTVTIVNSGAERLLSRDEVEAAVMAAIPFRETDEVRLSSLTVEEA